MGELNPYIEMEKNARESMASIRRELSALLDEKKSLEDNSPYWEFLAKGFGARGIKNFVFDEVVFALTEMSQSYLDHMTGGTMQIRFDPRKENKGGGFVEAIGLEITQNGESLDDFLLWSQGERKRVGLAVDLAMNQLLSEMFGSSLEFLVFDEAFDGLDKTGVEMFCGLLRKHLKRVPQILVVSHSPYSADLFDSEIVVVKEGGFSRVLPADRPDPRKSSLPRLE
jgi:DNA repair exonuclease SbcCD ATPase subunit